MSRTLNGWQALLLGLVVLVGGALAAAGLFAVGQRGWFGKNALTVKAGFDDIDGVAVGTRVLFQGIEAGEVLEILPPDGPDSPVMLHLRIKSDYRHLVRNSSTVSIVMDGVIGGKVVKIKPGTRKPGQPPLDLRHADEGAILPSEKPVELSEVVGEVRDAVKGLHSARGKLDEIGTAAVSLLKNSSAAVDKSKDTMASIQRSSDALGKLPIIRNYYEDSYALLARTGAERNRKVLAEADLFEPGRAALTSSGKSKLDEVGRWAVGLKHKGSDIVVVSYADPKQKGADAKLARMVTKEQSETVAKYLKEQHKVHKMSGWNPWSERKVTTLGMGLETPPPSLEKEKPGATDGDPLLPPARVEVLVFVPQS